MTTIIGADLGATKLKVGLFDTQATSLDELVVPTARVRDEIIGQLASCIRRLSREDTVGVGISVAALVRHDQGLVVQAVNLPLIDVPLASVLSQRTMLPVVIDNDGTCAALADASFGPANGARVSVTVMLGTGVGGGVVMDGCPYRGASGIGPELGHLVVDPHGPPCLGSCPGRGHLEAYASGSAVARRAGTDSAQRVVELAERGDPAARAVLEEAGQALGHGLVSIIHAFEPDIVTIGGGFGSAAGPHMVPVAAAVAHMNALSPFRDLPIVPSPARAHDPSAGAALLALRTQGAGPAAPWRSG